MNKIAFIFPGQGAQYVGMGKDFFDNFPVARTVFEEASYETDMDMKELCFEDPQNELTKTENTQPAILTTSIAILRVLEKEGFTCGITAGLSLGEYASLVKSNVFSFGDAVRLVQKRGRYMQNEVPIGVGTMAAILGLDREKVKLCIESSRQYGIVEAANYNCPGQIVVSGEIKAVESTVKIAKEIGAKKAVLLSVSAPFLYNHFDPWLLPQPVFPHQPLYKLLPHLNPLLFPAFRAHLHPHLSLGNNQHELVFLSKTS